MLVGHLGQQYLHVNDFLQSNLLLQLLLFWLYLILISRWSCCAMPQALVTVLLFFWNNVYACVHSAYCHDCTIALHFIGQLH